MSKFVVVDTEGNGLFRYDLPADAEGQPRLAALAMIFLNESLEIEREWVRLVKPDGWVMSAEAEAINGLSMDRLNAEGVPIAEVLEAYTAAINDGYVVAAHNAQFDCKALRGALRLAGMDDLFERTPNFCTMRKSAGIIPKAGGKKGWPKLSEAKAFLIERGRMPADIPDAPHTPLHDALVCVAILRFLHDEGVDLTPEIHRGKPGKMPESKPEAVSSAVKLADQELPK